METEILKVQGAKDGWKEKISKNKTAFNVTQTVVVKTAPRRDNFREMNEKGSKWWGKQGQND